jgi:hypothetical protein
MVTVKGIEVVPAGKTWFCVGVIIMRVGGRLGCNATTPTRGKAGAITPN